MPEINLAFLLLPQLWSPFAQHGWKGALTEPSETPYCTRALHRHAAYHVSQDFSTRNTEEDKVMLAFFDTLVQRELETWYTKGNKDKTAAHARQMTSSEGSSGSSTEQSENSSSPTVEEEQSEADTPNVSEISWLKYPNRIFYLIAKKRSNLLELALKATGGQDANVDQLMTRLLGEQREGGAGVERISDWLEETQRFCFGNDDELPTTSAEAARERRRRECRSPRKDSELRTSK